MTNHYDGTGGVPVGGIVRRTAFALSFGDFNILISGQVKPGSRVIYYRNVVQRLENAAPFLSYDGDPYPVVINGRLYWVEDAYTTTANFPYAQQANPVGTSRLPGTSELGYENFNYIRNSVKCVVDAYNGTMWFFVQDPNDPIIEAYHRAFPKLFTKMSDANSIIPNITSHWRYPEDLFTVQTDMYGRYHQTNAQVFYTNSQQWGIAQNPSSGEVNAATTTVPPLPGALVPVQQAPAQSVMPIYELTALPGQTQQSFVLVQPFVPSSNGDKQNLTAFMTAASDQDDYGQLTVFTIPAGQTVDGPYLVSTAVTTNSAISEEITLLSQRGSKVVLGNVIMVAIDQSLLYVQPLYVEGASNGVPRLDDVLVVYNNTAYHSGSGNPSLDAAICQITNPDGSQPFHSYCPTTSEGGSPPVTTPPHSTGPTSTTVPSSSSTTTTQSSPATTLVLPNQHNTVAQDLAEAQQDFSYANAALRQGDLATYQNDIGAGEALEALATKLAEAETTTTTAHGFTTRPPSTTTTTRRGLATGRADNGMGFRQLLMNGKNATYATRSKRASHRLTTLPLAIASQDTTTAPTMTDSASTPVPPRPLWPFDSRPTSAPPARAMKRFPPRTLPTTSSCSPRRAPWTDEAINGAEVPIPTMVSPAKPWVMPRRAASPTAQFTIRSAPPSITTRLPIARVTSGREPLAGFSRNSTTSASSWSGPYWRALNSSSPSTGRRATAITTPFAREIPSRARTAKRATETTLNGASRRTVAEPTRTGVMSAAIVRARHTFAATEPTRLPTASWGECRAAARAATMSSTMLVPNPPRNTPTTVGRNFRVRASRAMATMNWSPPKATSTRLTIRPAISPVTASLHNTRLSWCRPGFPALRPSVVRRHPSIFPGRRPGLTCPPAWFGLAVGWVEASSVSEVLGSGRALGSR